MFHRFNDCKNNSTGQGSFSPSRLKEYIESIGKDNFFNIEDIINLRKKSIIPDGKILLTFDDGLFSQYQSAKPILDDYGIKSIWFIYTKILEKNFDENEILNFFISTYFSSFDEFYRIFESLISPNKINWDSKLFNIYCKEIDSKFNFYTLLDKKFRFLRNKILTEREFRSIVMEIIESRGLKFNELGNKIWIDENMIKEISADGHEVGLHSHTHPYEMKKLAYSEQFLDYKKNYDYLTRICSIRPISVAYPLGSYNYDTLRVMNKLDIRIGFISSRNILKKYKNLGDQLLSLPRIDSSNIK